MLFPLLDARAASGGLSCTQHNLYLWPFLGVLVCLFTVGPLELVEAGKGKDRKAIPPLGAGERCSGVAAWGRPPLVERLSAQAAGLDLRARALAQRLDGALCMLSREGEVTATSWALGHCTVRKCVRV